MKKFLFYFMMFFLFFLSINNVFAYSAPVDVTSMSISDIQNAIKESILTYEELVNIYLDRIKEYDDTYNTIITINPNIIEEAKVCDENKSDLVLYCIPILVKDNIDVVGMPTTAGSYALTYNYPNSDSYAVSMLKEAGAIILGKTNMSEFAFYATSSISDFGTVKNAYNSNLTSYGSSGGSATAVALSFAPVALGTDTNLSVRAPASANNLYGIRSSINAISTDGVIAYDITRDTVGVITKYASDNAIVTAVLEGYDYNFDDTTGNLDGVTIGVLTEFLDGDKDLDLNSTNTKIKELFNNTITNMENAGANIVYIDDFYKNSFNDINYSTMAGLTMCDAFNSYIKNTNSSIDSFNALVSKASYDELYAYLDDCGTSEEHIKDFDEIKKNFLDSYNELFTKYNLTAITFPTLSDYINNSYISTNADLISPVLGIPEITMPMGNINGLYYGMSLLGTSNDDKLLLDIALNYEQINFTYKLPTDADNLYDISYEVKDLINVYLENKDNDYLSISNKKLIDEYSMALDSIKDFFINYNSYEDLENTATKLKNNYETAIFNINNYKENNISLFVFGIILIAIIFLFIKIIISKKRKHYKKES